MEDSLQDTQASVSFELNSKLDLAALRREFRVKQRLQIQSILEQDAAAALYRYLSTQMQWSLLLEVRKKTYEVAPEAAGQRDPQANRKLLEYVYTAARDGFAFIYGTHRRSSRHATAANAAGATTLLTRFGEFLNSAAFIDFARELTGKQDLRQASAQATCFRPGHFLSFHDDDGEGAKQVAYVFNLSRDWRAQWGGLLQFAGPDGSVNDCYLPRFNSLSIFCVPQSHAVSLVAPFAGEARYAVSGWLHGATSAG